MSNMFNSQNFFKFLNATIAVILAIIFWLVFAYSASGDSKPGKGEFAAPSQQISPSSD